MTARRGRDLTAVVALLAAATAWIALTERPWIVRWATEDVLATWLDRRVYPETEFTPGPGPVWLLPPPLTPETLLDQAGGVAPLLGLSVLALLGAAAVAVRSCRRGDGGTADRLARRRALVLPRRVGLIALGLGLAGAAWNMAREQMDHAILGAAWVSSDRTNVPWGTAGVFGVGAALAVLGALASELLGWIATRRKAGGRR